MIFQKLKTITSLYTKTVFKNCLSFDSEESGLPYWQNRLFALIMVYLLPLCLIAIVPGVVVSLKTGEKALAIFDISVFFVLSFVAFDKKCSVQNRKRIFIGLIYMVSLVLLFFLGFYGPGLLYLLTAIIFSILIFHRQIAYWAVVLNVIICIVFGFSVYYHKLNSAISTQQSIASWVAVSSNLILLSILLAALLPGIFRGFQNTIEEQYRLKMQLAIEQRSLEKTLKLVSNKNKELEEFAYMTSHDLQEPLRVISGLLALLEKNHSMQLDEKGLQYLGIAKDGADRMKRTITDLLAYSLASKQKYRLEEVDVNAVLANYVAEIKTHIDEKKAVIYWNLLPRITADKLSLQQIFQNLISNALKYQKKGVPPQITITCQETKKYWQFAFSDNGIGIPEQEADRVFVAFNRLHSKSEYPGTGIGLAICKKIVRKHKGKIWVESEPDKGSTFYFTILKNLN